MPALSISTVGKRKERIEKHERGQQEDALQRATSRVLERLVSDSRFFESNPPRPLPAFEIEEIELGDCLGKGEFGVVNDVSAFHIEEDCPCESCNSSHEAQQSKTENSAVSSSLIPSNTAADSATFARTTLHSEQSATHSNFVVETFTSSQPQQTSTEFATPIVADDTPSSEESTSPPTNPSCNSTLPRNPASSSRGHLYSRGVSFSEDVKVPDDDESTLSTDDDLDDDIQNEDNPQSELQSDGEVEFLQSYMTKHCFRSGLPRYAVKRLRPDLENKDRLEAAIDLASEAKFMASINHPNIVKMRGTVGIPGTIGFMIIMDRLKMTLRQKMDSWKEEEKQNKKGRIFSFFEGARRKLSDDLFADKLLAVYDIARALRYLHNNLIVFRDLKPENVAFDLRGDMRLFDFGLARELKNKDLVERPEGFNLTGLTGTRRYMAPEVVLCKYYGLKADVYSFAILMWEVLSGGTAYPKMSFDRHFDQVVIKGKRPKNLKWLPIQLQKLFRDAWQEDSMNRPPLSSICDQLGTQMIAMNSVSARVVSDRTATLMNQSLRSRMDSADSAIMGSERSKY